MNLGELMTPNEMHGLLATIGLLKYERDVLAQQLTEMATTIQELKDQVKTLEEQNNSVKGGP
jgi:uncharacterized coiled-coil DUF342 family protein